MENPSKQAINELLDYPAEPAVTIYIPMHTTASPPHISENQIRFKNLMHQAAAQLQRPGDERTLARLLDDTVRDSHDDRSFWESQTPGLLVCASPGMLRMFHLPVNTEEYVSIDHQFHLAPLFGILADARDFYVLTIAQQKPRLYQGDQFGLRPSDIALPPTIAQALNIDENNQKSENQGTAAGPSTQGGVGSGRGWFNGRGGGRNPQAEDRIRFFRRVDSLICSHATPELPLILAGVETDIAEYRALSKYPALLGRTISGNHTGTQPGELFKLAWTIIQQKVIDPEHRAAIEEYTRLQGANPGRVAQDKQNVIDAAEQGRIYKLLTPVYRATSDTVQDTRADMLQITFPVPSEAKILNRVATKVWQMSGKIINVLPEQLPHNPPMAARLRY